MKDPIDAGALLSAVAYESRLDRRTRLDFHGKSPTVLREGAFRLFFFSREEPRVHVHVAHPDGEAKFWLVPQVELAVVVGLSARQTGEAEDIVRRHIEEIQNAWTRHFGR